MFFFISRFTIKFSCNFLSLLRSVPIFFISLRGVTMIYKKRGQKHVTALEGLNLRLCESKIMVLFGHLNSGKSTLIRIISGRVRPTSGKIIFHGYNWPSDIYKSIATIPERSDLYDWLTPYEILKFYARIRNVNVVDQHLLIENLLLELGKPNFFNYLVDKDF